MCRVLRQLFDIVANCVLGRSRQVAQVFDDVVGDAAKRHARPRAPAAGGPVQEDRLSEARRQAHLRPAVIGLPVQHQPQRGPAGPPHAEGPGDPGAGQPRALRRARGALLPGRRLRVRRPGNEAPAADQRAELRALQDLRHQGSAAEHRLGRARGRRRAQLPEHVIRPRRPRRAAASCPSRSPGSAGSPGSPGSGRSPGRAGGAPARPPPRPRRSP